MDDPRKNARRWRAVAIAAIAAALVMVCGAPALAQAPVVVTPIQVELWPDNQGRTSVIAVADVPETTKLPAAVRMPLPAGAQLTWAGEIIGTDASGDKQQMPTIAAGEGGQYVQLQATVSHRMQYESLVGTPTVRGTSRIARLEWVQTAPGRALTFAVRIPLAATNVSIVPAPVGDAAKNQELNAMLYGLAPVSLRPGQKYTVTVSYDVPQGASTAVDGSQGGTSGQQTGADGAQPSAGNSTPGWLVAVILLAIVLIPVLLLMTRRRTRQEATHEDSEVTDVHIEDPDAEDAEDDEGAFSAADPADDADDEV